ncbi:DedA family protein [Paenibacillus mucilaginosus]|uniref:VTT domain-containing protein n=3 Tax=Paenibacillus mucilaginosus TaxID=61624 RepID=H6NHZ5_9BACL|nr:DedA family protein [Paenibacillus mucilaginosus]AEI43088.1 SNARE associated Golgi protein [Paenibacillus mucilaginosus KNP414]AFC30766.1 hypothetical protein PM3016_3975 [Paenibacillus mucilaginosus 3016]AFH63089.1 alkaline phosphatase [Paenibacillus mucilaginosus K02]MCG7212337.1 DedA family protein [Paenibacillus mucilaginosus]WDM24705.1 DedA family protein [Paenibacillus mucilaginosus]
MKQWITEFMSDFGYLGVFALIALESVFPPIPSELILTLSGFMTTTAGLSIWGVILSATAGSLAGALCLYAAGRRMSPARMESFVTRYGRLLRLKREDIRRAQSWFEAYGAWAVGIGRLVPLLRSLISIPAGSTSMKLSSFVLFTVLGSLIWNSVLVYAGAAVGASWENIAGVLDTYSHVVYAGIAVGVIFFLWRLARRRSREEAGE